MKKIGELIKVSKLFADDTLKVHRENVFEEIRLKIFSQSTFSKKRYLANTI
ncbi:hypothetical protein LCGC14_1313380 [marine sediment metagenome]|uniref:Uncharacterized protein n=1 Tax=marine sediment metagenome TaxID=412755 RepID=A0A0F9NP32_9ZZZZ